MLCYNQDSWIMKYYWSPTEGTDVANPVKFLGDRWLHRLYAKYYQKMDSHSQKVNDIEQSHNLYQQVAILQENISKTSHQSKE